MLEGIIYTIWILVVLFFVLSFFLNRYEDYLDEGVNYAREEEELPAVFNWRRK